MRDRTTYDKAPRSCDRADQRDGSSRRNETATIAKKLEQEMYGTVLEVSRFPEAVFESKQITVQKLGE